MPHSSHVPSLPGTLKPMLEMQMGTGILAARHTGEEGDCDVFALDTARGPHTVRVCRRSIPNLFFAEVQALAQRREAGEEGVPDVIAFADAPYTGLGAPGQAAPAFLLLKTKNDMDTKSVDFLKYKEDAEA
ncbi:hypothetical protein E7T06_12775 [Deinococcus sp. Arct2-2]|uniref:hypothetical protein n=1 Tax=Deinococcus sp. Arct2-2 TaxID=2568653 RepID=UPI0010A3132F|nr:hypothetical protein [Deinococcus sp. Arct2-2]THF69252.1 hypothetical protein E7T06_12775 [Deinococcus sp. Arct2-2]